MLTLYTVSSLFDFLRNVRVSWLASSLLKDKVSSLPGLPVAPFVERFIEELNLPFEMVPFVLGLLDRINSAKYQIEYTSLLDAKGYKKTKNAECRIMSCIFYALRLLFVLDESTENHISNATEQMQLMAPTVNLFNFRVWYQHLTHRRALLFKHTMLSRQVCSSSAHADFVQMNQAPLSDIKKKDSRVIKNWKARDLQLRLVHALHKLNIEKTSSPLLVNLPATVRPYRAHTEALSEHYPELAVDFSHHTIKHLLEDQSWITQLIPVEIAADVRGEVESVQRTRKISIARMPLLRFFRNRYNGSKKQVEEENLPRMVRDLVRTLAEMIDHEYEYFFGSLVFLELAFFPKNPLCTRIRNSREIKHLKLV